MISNILVLDGEQRLIKNANCSKVLKKRKIIGDIVKKLEKEVLDLKKIQYNLV